ncbi:MAG: hypothetical protein LBT00_04305 [Spirochaetaceae bacterium]|nr:hypothetical protein [Spirochaetaceae bacterium]
MPSPWIASPFGFAMTRPTRNDGESCHCEGVARSNPAGGGPSQETGSEARVSRDRADLF